MEKSRCGVWCGVMWYGMVWLWDVWNCWIVCLGFDRQQRLRLSGLQESTNKIIITTSSIFLIREKNCRNRIFIGGLWYYYYYYYYHCVYEHYYVSQLINYSDSLYLLLDDTLRRRIVYLPWGRISTPSRVNSNSKKFASMPEFCMHDVMDFIVRWYVYRSSVGPWTKTMATFSMPVLSYVTAHLPNHIPI